MTSKYFLRALALCVAATLCSGNGWAQGTCGTAIPGPAVGATVLVDNSGTADLFTGSCAFDNAPDPNTGNEVWHSLGVLAAGNYRLETTTSGSITDTVMSLFTGACPGTLVTCNDDTTGLFSRIDFVADGVAEFNVVTEVWGGHATQLGTWNLTLTAMAAPMPPPNDLCANATVVSVFPFSDSVSLSLTNDEGVDNSASIGFMGGGGRDVFYSITSVAGGDFNVTALGDDLGIGLFASCGGAEIDAVDDTFGGETLDFTIAPGGTVIVLVEGFDGTIVGDITVDITEVVPAVVPPNDLCVNAIVVDPSMLPFMDSFDLGGASDEGTDNSASVGFMGGAGRDVFYSFTPTVTGIYSILADIQDTGIGVFAAPCVGAEIAALDNFTGPETMFINLTSGVEVLILVEGFDPSIVGPVDVVIDGPIVPPANDLCATPTNIAALPFTDTVDTNAASNDGFDTSVTTDPAVPEIWYTFTPAASGSYGFVADSLDFDTVVGIYTGACGSLTAVIEVDDVAPGFFGFEPENFRVDLTMGTAYTVVVEGATLPGTGSVTLTVDGPFIAGPGDECAQAVAGPAVGATVLVDTSAQGNFLGADCSDPGLRGNDLWMDLGVLPAGNYSMETTDAGDLTDTILTVYQGPCPGVQVACDDDSSAGLFSLLAFTADGVNNYFVLAQAYGVDLGGSFNLSLNAITAVANDTCATATVVDPNALPFSDSFDIGGANDEGTDNSASIGFGGGMGRDVFYSFTPNVTGDYLISAQGPDVGIGVFAAPCVGAEIAALDDFTGGEMMTISLTSGVEVLILVEGFDVSIAAGTVDVTISAIAAPAGAPGFGADLTSDNFISIGLGNAGVSTIAPTGADYNGGDFAGSDLTTFWAATNATPRIDAIDADTGAVTPGAALTGRPVGHAMVSMAWNPAQGQFWATTIDTGTFGTVTLGPLNHTTGVYTPMHTYSADPIPQAIAFDASGNSFLFMVGFASPFPVSLATVDLGTGATTVLGPCGVDDAAFFDADFDETDGTLYYVSGSAGVRTVNTATGATVSNGTLGAAAVNAFAVRTSASAGVDNWSAY